MKNESHEISLVSSLRRVSTECPDREFKHHYAYRLKVSFSLVIATGLPAVESIMSLLKGVAGRWKEIAEGLGFDEDHTEDEIFTNNSTDEACLQDCVEQWIAKLQPSWEKLSHVLRDMGEEELARKAWSGKGNVLQ